MTPPPWAARGTQTREGVKPLHLTVTPILLSLGQAGQGDSLVCTGAPLGAQPLPPIQDTAPRVGQELGTHWGRGTTRPLRISSPRLENSETGGGKKAAGIAWKAGEGGCWRLPPQPTSLNPGEAGKRPAAPPSQLRADFAPHLLCAPCRGERRKKKTTKKTHPPALPSGKREATSDKTVIH